MSVHVRIETEVTSTTPGGLLDSVSGGDPARIIVRELDDAPAGATGRRGREVRVTTLRERIDIRPEGVTYAVVVEGPVQTLVGRDHTTHRGGVAYLPATLDGRPCLLDYQGRELDARLRPLVRGEGALRALAEGRTA